MSKALLVPFPFPPNTTLIGGPWTSFWAKSYLQQVLHWSEQIEGREERDREQAAEGQPSDRESPIGAVIGSIREKTDENYRLAWLFLIGSGGLGLTLVFLAFRLGKVIDGAGAPDEWAE